MADADIDCEEITDVLLIGGSAPIPCIKSVVKQFFEGQEIDLEKSMPHCEDLAAYGAAIFAKNSILRSSWVNDDDGDDDDAQIFHDDLNDREERKSIDDVTYQSG